VTAIDAIARAGSGALGPLARRIAPRVGGDPISIARGALAAPVVAALALGWPAPVGLALYAAAWMTDILDGAVARERRRLGLPGDPDRGELIDTVADKVLLLAVALSLAIAAPGPVERAVLATLLVGEGYLLGKRIRDYRGGRRAYPPMALGRPKVWIQAIAIGALVAARLGAAPAWASAGTLLLGATLPLVALSIWAKRSRRGAALQVA
jgi:phosphatidylglycerophosphate synthase